MPAASLRGFGLEETPIPMKVVITTARTFCENCFNEHLYRQLICPTHQGLHNVDEVDCDRLTIWDRELYLYSQREVNN